MALSPLDSVPVDVKDWNVRLVNSQPAVKRERDASGGWVVTPKMRDGVEGIEIDCLATVPGIDGQKTLKFTLYSPVPSGVELFAPVRLLGVRAAPWASGNRSGLWFDVAAIEPVSPARGGRGE